MPIVIAHGGSEIEPEEKSKKKSVLLVSGGEPISRKKGKTQNRAKTPKISRKRNPAKLTKQGTKKTKKELTADEAFMLAWQDTWNKRHKRVA